LKTDPSETLASGEVRRKRGLTVEDWAEIRRLHRSEGMPIKVIARAMGCSKNTVKQALRSDGAPSYVRAPRGSMVDEVEPRIRELLRAWPTMPATVVAERIGWGHSIRILRDRVSDRRVPDGLSGGVHNLGADGDRVHNQLLGGPPRPTGSQPGLTTRESQVAVTTSRPGSASEVPGLAADVHATCAKSYGVIIEG
jgi:hypothetical protein